MSRLSTLLGSRAAAEHTGRTLGLGWLLAFSLGGAVLLFTCVGLLLAWRIKKRPESRATTTTIYEVSDRPNPGRLLGFTKRLTRRKYVMAQSTSRLSLTLPPILPVPAPTYQAGGSGGGGAGAGGSADLVGPNRKRSRSWVEEDKFHGPKVSKSFRDSWFKRDSWLAKAPTLPSLMLDDAEKGSFDDILDQQQTQQPPYPPLNASQIAPAFPTRDLGNGSPSRIQLPVIAPLELSMSMADSDLHDILRSTDLRLRDGKHGSPVKTPSSTPAKTSPVKTPHSQKTISTQGSIRSIGTVGTAGTVRVTRMTFSPSKRATIQSVPAHTHTHSRNVSISSIGSAAQSLIAEATQELVLPNGQASPSRLRSHHQWEPQDDQIIHLDVEPRGRPRTRSLESDQSSSLSTVYSVGEQEEKRAEQHSPQNGVTYSYDPFVEGAMPAVTGHQPRPTLFGPRLYKQTGQNMRAPYSSNPIPRAIQPQLRHSPRSTQPVGGLPRLAIVLDPPADGHAREAECLKPVSQDVNSPTLPLSPSITSMVTPSVTTIVDSDDDDTVGAISDKTESPKSGRPLPHSHEHSTTTADAISPSTMTSSPFDEQDMLSMLMSSSAPRRALPEPPRHYSHIDESIMPIPLSPRPRRDFSEQLRKLSVVSNVSSQYEEESAVGDPAAVSTGSPGRRSTFRSVKCPSLPPPPRTDSAIGVGSVGNSVAELRRMNSMISSYSVASMTSSVYEPESPTLPTLRGGGCSPSRPNSKTDIKARKSYLSLGSPPKGDITTGIRSSSGRLLSTNHSVSGGLTVEIREDDLDEAHEIHDKDLNMPRVDVSISSGALREARRASNQGRESLRMSMLKLGTVAEHHHDMGRASPDTSGEYDEDGFLKGSPEISEKDLKGLYLRM
ncbi:hypothetical protein B0J13DRAFT_439121 [Dactylonectria estremocensis]|uniref:Uncharacterized protein n=1 Tax=Dactylonectria estremocensis TaxID=1079267 RepID=A0A9P9JB00_9HYPO|nr:hypothetical protein B0J13DRAFT_439121 [Dactylonectria estremocensis]